MNNTTTKARQRAQETRGQAVDALAPPKAENARAARTRSFSASIGRSKFDNRPIRQELATFADLVELIDKTRASAKGGAFICGTFSDDKRGKAGATPRAWLAMDIDAASTKDMAHVLQGLPTFANCCWWHTHSHKPDSANDEDHRLRIVVELDRDCTRDEQKKAGAGLAAFLLAQAPSLKFDPCTYRPEQPVYLPPPGAVVGVGHGQVLNVESLLSLAPAAAPPRPARPKRQAAPPAVVRRAAAALNVLDPDDLPLEYLGAAHRYDAIFTVACAAEDAGVSLEEFDLWCAQGGDYPGEDEVTKRWNSIAVGEVREGTLYGAVDHVKPGWTTSYWKQLPDEDRDQVKAWPAAYELPMDHQGQAAYDGMVVPRPWSTPIDFVTAPKPVPLTRDMFPPVIADHAWTYAKAAGHDPGAYAMAMMGATSGALNDRVRVRLSVATDYYEKALLWVNLLGNSASAKSVAISVAITVLEELQKGVSSAFDVEQAAWEATQAFKRNPKGMSENQKHLADKAGAANVRKPVHRMYILSDMTIEALSDLLRDQPRGVLVVQHELDTFIGSMDAYRGGGGGGASRDRGLWLALAEGKPLPIARVQRGRIYVPNWGASILMAGTFAALKKCARQLPADGLTARFLTVVVAQTVARDTSITEEMIAMARKAYGARIAELAKDDGTEGATVVLDDDAQAVFDQFVDLVPECASGAEEYADGFAAHVGKARAHLAQLAFTAHMAQHGLAGLAKPITGADMKRAGRLLRALWGHAEVMYCDVMQTGAEHRALAIALARSIAADGRRTLTGKNLADICKAWKDQPETRIRAQALTTLEENGWMRVAVGAGSYNGLPTLFEVNPAVATLFKEVADHQRELRAATKAKIAGLFDES